MAYYEGEIAPMCYGNGNNNGWSNGWEGIIGLAVVAALFGNGGFGFGGNGGRGTCATAQDLASGFASNSVLSNLNDIILSQAQGFAGVQQTLCQGFSGVNATVTNGFANLNTNLASLAYNTQSGFTGLSREIADCCCTTQRNIDSVRYDMSRGFCDVIRANQDNTRAILDYLTGEKIESLRAENVALKGQISNDRQSAYITDTILDKLSPCPKPAYITCNPNAPYGYGYGVPFGAFGGCCGASVQ